MLYGGLFFLRGLRAIKVIIKEEPVPEKIMQNETFRHLLDSVKLINFVEELFNAEVKNMTDLKAEHEIGFSEGRVQGRTEGFVQGKTEGFVQGKTEGFSQGRKEERADSIAVLREMGLSAEKVAEFQERIETLNKKQ